MATSDRDDLVSQLRALDEQLASVPPRPHLEARLRARLRAAEAAPAAPALRDAVRGFRRPLAAGLLAAAALALGLDDGAGSAIERWGVAARRLAAPAEPAAGEPRADSGPAEPGPARPSVSPPPAPVAPAPDPRRRALLPDPRRAVEEPPPPDVTSSPPPAPASPPEPSSTPVAPERGRDLLLLRGDPGGPRLPGVPEPSLFSVPRAEERGPGAAGRAGDEEAGRTGGEEAARAGDEEAERTGGEEAARAGDEEAERALPEASVTPEEEAACSTDLLFDGVTCPDDCTSGVLGDGVTCQDPNVLIEQGIPICEELGLVLRDIQVDKADYAVCDGKVLQATYLCCPAWEAPPEEPREPPPPPAPPCETTGVVGDGMTCEDPNALKYEALALCQALGLPLSHFDASIAPCEKGTLKATYACCP
ncbi:hypothetical protein [Sorangium sp. So ce1099]|uniref:hypothetical protein n=1 Tax=Sorangium sp. So ce1099 TaxID=3133331 RepID=UPI003F6132FB